MKYRSAGLSVSRTCERLGRLRMTVMLALPHELSNGLLREVCELVSSNNWPDESNKTDGFVGKCE